MLALSPTCMSVRPLQRSFLSFALLCFPSSPSPDRTWHLSLWKARVGTYLVSAYLLEFRWKAGTMTEESGKVLPGGTVPQDFLPSLFPMEAAKNRGLLLPTETTSRLPFFLAL